MRNTICVSNLDPDLHDWLKKEAERRTAMGQRVTMSNLFNEAVTLLRQRREDEEAIEQAKAKGEEWALGAASHVN